MCIIDSCSIHFSLDVFWESSEALKAGIFVFVLMVFILLAHFSFKHTSPSNSISDRQNIDAAIKTIDDVVIKELPSLEEMRWLDPTDKSKKYYLTPIEVCILETFRGKPDVRWTKDVILNSSNSSARFSKAELTLAIESLEKSRYLSCTESGVYRVMDLAIAYYRATKSRKIHEIDETDCWYNN